MKTEKILPWGRILAALAALALLVWFFAALGSLEQGQQALGRTRLEDALRQACVACYATEGFYPPTVEYLCRHYGIQLDESRYTVFYEVFAENLMPSITVLEKE